MRREFAITVESSIPGFTLLKGFVRLTGTLIPGSVVSTEGLLPNGPLDQIPDEWNNWQGPKLYTVGADGYVEVKLMKSVGWITIRVGVVTKDNIEYLVGKGTVLGFDFKITKSKRYLYEEAPVVDLDTEFELVPLYSSKENQFKGSGICVEADGTVVLAVYGNDNPRNRTAILEDGVKVYPKTGYYDAETLTPYPQGFIVAERGFQIRKTDAYRPTKCLCKWAAAYAQGVVYSAERTGGGVVGMNFMTGTKIGELPGTDVPHEAKLLPNGSTVVAIENFGLVFTDGRTTIPCKPRGMHVIDSRILVGDAGYLKEVVGNELALVINERIGEVIDSITHDAAGIWLTTSNPDACYLIPTGTRSLQLIGRKFDDDQQGGSVFGCEVATNGSVRVFMRNNGKAGNRWEVYKIVERGSNLTNEPIDVSTVQWMNGSLAGYTPKSGLKASINDGKITFELEKGIGGNNLSAVSICRRDGKLYGGTFDAVGSDGGKTLFVKLLTNMGSNSNEKGGPYWAGDSASNRKRFKPIKNEPMWVMIVDKSTQARTLVAEIIWPEGSEAPAPEEPVVNKGGDGLYKPETRLWLLPEGPSAPQINVAGEYKPGGELVKHLRIGKDNGALADGKQVPTDNAEFYHNGRVVLRNAVVSANGNSLLAWTRNGQKFKMTVINRGVRQEGRSK